MEEVVAPLMGYIPALATGFALTIFLLEYVLAISIMRVKGKRAPLASGYSNIPFIGHARHLSSESFVAFIWDSWRDAQYGDFEIFVLWKRILCISDFQTAKDILMRRPKTFRRTREFENWGKELGVVGGNGLFNVEGIEWGRIRRLTSSSFATQHVNSMTDLITKNARDLLNTFQKHVDTNRPDVAISASPSFLGYTMATMYALAFGDVLNEIEYLHSNKISEDIKLLFNFFFRRSTIPLPKWMWTQWNDSLEREGQAAMRRLDDSTRTIVSKLLTDSSIRKSLFLETLMAAHTDDVDSRSPHSTGEKGDKSPGNVTIDEANEQSRRPSGQSRRNRNQLSTEELSAQIKTFLLAGTDTSSNLISTLFYHISLPGNAGLQEELYQEVLGVLGECDSIQNLAQVEQLTLLDATLKEANRMNGPVPILTMGVASDTENVTLSSGYVVSPKDTIFINSAAIMHDPEIFPEPFVFNPHRWLPSASNATTAATRKSDVEQSDSKKERQRLSEMHERHLGFGFGPRSCPGMRLAVVEGKCAVANILRNFRVRLGCSSDEVKWVRQFTVQPSKLPLLLARRDADM